MELRNASKDDDFYEPDLEQCPDELKKGCTQSPYISIREHNTDIVSSIPKISASMLSNEIFEQSIGNIRIEEDDEVIIKRHSTVYAMVRSSDEYTGRKYHFRFKIEVNSLNKWLFIEIGYKKVLLQERSYISQSIYCWSGGNRAFINGVCHPGFNSSTCLRNALPS